MHNRLAYPVSFFCLLVIVGAGPSAAALKMFVTSGTHNGNFTGVGGPDGFCQTAANNAVPPLTGTFKAWVSTSADDAYCRVAGFSGKVSPTNCGQPQLPNGGPWARVDGLPFARSLQALTMQSQILTPGMIDENGDPLVAVPGSTKYVFTGSTFAGTYLGSLFTTCADWTVGDDTSAVRYGIPFTGPFQWTDYNSGGVCDEPHRLYCFEVGPSTPLSTYEYDGALAFITSESHDGNYVGLSGADTYCQGLAADAFLPNASSFVAWLSDSSTDAIDRLTYDGPYKRVDGVPIATSKADLVDAATPQDNALIAGLWKTELDVSNYFFAFTGTATNGQADAETCNNWMSNLNTDHAEFGSGTSSLGTWTQDSPLASPLPCSATSYYLYCFSNEPILFWDNFEGFPPLQRWSSAQQ
jgi:hypothetical protein